VHQLDTRPLLALPWRGGPICSWGTPRSSYPSRRASDYWARREALTRVELPCSSLSIHLLVLRLSLPAPVPELVLVKCGGIGTGASVRRQAVTVTANDNVNVRLHCDKYSALRFALGLSALPFQSSNR
jgi:hypothetical protein